MYTFKKELISYLKNISAVKKAMPRKYKLLDDLITVKPRRKAIPARLRI